MKEVVAHLTAAEWQTLITATIAAVAAAVVTVLNAWQNKQIVNKIEEHDARSTAARREQGQAPNPPVTPADRGHLK